MAIASPDPAFHVGRIDRRRDLGRRGEEAVAEWYARAGYEVLGRNWRCRDGEIDLVVVDPGGVLVFCEVKTRSSTAFGAPLDAVTAIKQKRLRRLAARWLSQVPSRGATMRPVRFDVAGVMEDHSGALLIEIVDDAF
ncbi:MAG TPA: YraN family protein [Acidimicrobiales bacterium]|nr:YraN family protein [Acidimicrobiales bacterium]